MPTRRETKCCHAFSVIGPRLEEVGVSCITEHEGFVANCLNRWVLEASYYEYKQDNGPLEEGELIHKYVFFLKLLIDSIGVVNHITTTFSN
jgi:hypothetical protein